MQAKLNRSRQQQQQQHQQRISHGAVYRQMTVPVRSHFDKSNTSGRVFKLSTDAGYRTLPGSSELPGNSNGLYLQDPVSVNLNQIDPVFEGQTRLQPMELQPPVAIAAATGNVQQGAVSRTGNMYSLRQARLRASGPQITNLDHGLTATPTGQNHTGAAVTQRVIRNANTTRQYAEQTSTLSQMEPYTSPLL